MNIKQNINLSKYTTFRIGGDAKYFVKVQNLDELKDAIKFSQEKNINYFILGGGSNILVSDDGYDGIVIKLDGKFKDIYFDTSSKSITVGAGVLLPHFVKECVSKGISGFEYLSGIPGTVGAGVCINAGTKRGEIKDNFIETQVMIDENIKIITNEQMCFAYRGSILKGKSAIILNAKFFYNEYKPTEVIKSIINEERLLRLKKQPKNKKNCGSIFKSSADIPAGCYIEQCGLKGAKVGGAMISNEHANWIVNDDNASSRDILELVNLMKSKVKEKFDIELELEMEYIN